MLLITFFLSATSFANTLTKVQLQYRDAEQVKALISPLLPEGSAVTAEANLLLISAPTATIKQVTGIIRSLDKPQKNLLVSVFRGEHPDTKGHNVATTKRQHNRLHTVYCIEGQTIVIGEDNILALPVETTHYYGLNPRGREVLQEGDAILQQQKKQLVDMPTGIHLQVTLVDKKQVRVATKVIDPSLQRSALVHKNSDFMMMANSVQTLTTLPLNSWSRLSQTSHFSHKVNLQGGKKTYSTYDSSDYKQSLWVKVTVQ